MPPEERFEVLARLPRYGGLSGEKNEEPLRSSLFASALLFLWAMIYQPSYQLKLDRAAEHSERVEAQERIWSEGNPRRVWTEQDIKSGYTFVWAEVLKPPLIMLAPIVGDCLHNLRSALDNLAYELALAHKGSRNSSVLGKDLYQLVTCPCMRSPSTTIALFAGGLHVSNFTSGPLFSQHFCCDRLSAR
jgi:hypothetical protein